ncbi:hypothetical protein BMG03_19675 (plasmid) [Thioclava nitratireducens]|uniref:Transposase n=1 Tax=Thioclava nitratireducens TaxID=1915078 RepID=A0ABM6IMR4_9RHOB|nr:hypothetical protein BMG03_19675 [Thioclava nitratireducens]
MWRGFASTGHGSVDAARKRFAGINNRGENSYQPIRRRERIVKGFKSPAHLQRFASIHGRSPRGSCAAV